MDIKKEIKRLEESKEFNEWKSKNKGILTYVFVLEDENKCQIGFYNSKKDRITAFDLGKDITVEKDLEVFKPDDVKIKELNIDDVKIGLDDAFTIAKGFQEVTYPNEKPIKRIAILQNIDMGIIWNITYVTRNLKTLNIKVDAIDGKIKKHKIYSVSDFSKNIK